MHENIKSVDIIYLGIPNDALNFDGAFRVLDSEKTNTGTSGMFLLSENLIGTGKGIIFKELPKPVNNEYCGSNAQKWCRDFFENNFTLPEKEAVLQTYKSDAAYVKIHMWELLGGKQRKGECPFSAAPGILKGDRLFPLSAEEAANPDYGLDSDALRTAYLGNKPAAWWLRSPHAPDFPKDVGIVFYNGWLLDFIESKRSVFGKAPICMRPALNLDAAKITDVIKINEYGEAENNTYREWTIRFAGESEKAFKDRRKRYAYGKRESRKSYKAPATKMNFIVKAGLTIFVKIVDMRRRLSGEKK